MTSMQDFQSRLEYGLNDKFDRKEILADIRSIYPKDVEYMSVFKTYTTNKTTNEREEVEDAIIVALPKGIKLAVSEYYRKQMVKRGHACVWDGVEHRIYNREIMLAQLDKRI